jgi:hypothetical protein
MGITTNARSVVAANMGGSALPSFTAIGIGSTAFSSSQTALVSEYDRNGITNVDLSTASEITIISDFTAIEMSGLSLREFGTFTLGSTMLNREVVVGSVVFNGDQSLQIQQTFQFFI